MEKNNLFLISLLQALGVAVYCGMVAGLFWLLKDFFNAPLPQFLGSAFMLMFLVFSVAVVGSLVFGYPAYLALKGRIKDAIMLILRTLVWILIILVIVISGIFIYA